MIHQVNRLPIANRLLPDVIALQITVLEAASQGHITHDMVLDSAVFTPLLQTYLETKRRFHGRGEAIARWIMTGKKGARKSLVEPLNKFANAQPVEKAQLITDMKSDICLLYRPRASTFHVAVLRNEQNDWKIGARDFLYEFYDLWHSGFPEFVFSVTRQKYSYQDFVQEFTKQNPNLFICAVCDGAAFNTKTDAHIYTSVDHFFPRSIYPHLSCHPLNLIPICSYCNSYIKGETNPLLLDDQPVELTDFVLPYQQPETAFREKAYIAVIKRNPPDRQKHPLRLELKPARDFQAGKRLNTFNNLYRVDERWSESLLEIEDLVFRRITQFLTLADPVKLTSDYSAFSRYLKVLMSQTDMENLGKDPYAFPMVWLLKSYIDQLEKYKANAAVFKGFQNWAAGNQQRWTDLEKHSVKIKERVPPDNGQA